MQIDQAAIDKIAETILKAIERKLYENNTKVVGNALKNYKVDGDHIVRESIGNVHIKDASIDTAKIRDLTAEVAQIAVAEIASATIDVAQINSLSAYVADIVYATIESADIEWADIANLTATIAAIAVANIETARINFAQIDGLVAGVALIQEAVGGKVQIADLSVSDANIVTLNANKIKAGTLSVERLVIVGSTQSIVYAVNEANGTAQLSQTTIDGGSITEKTITADQIIAHGITADCLNVAEIFANEALIGAITTSNIAAGTITAASAIIADGAITAAKIGDAQITTAKIGNAQITSAKIADANITTAKIGDAQITGAKIADATITGAKIANATITNANIAEATINSANIGDGQITTAKIGDAQITNAKINDLNASKINAGTLSADRIAAGSITTDKLGASSITAAKIAAGAITAYGIAAGTIIAGNLAAGCVTAGKIDAGAITTDKLAANCITAEMINALDIYVEKIRTKANADNYLQFLSETRNVYTEESGAYDSNVFGMNTYVQDDGASKKVGELVSFFNAIRPKSLYDTGSVFGVQNGTGEVMLRAMFHYTTDYESRITLGSGSVTVGSSNFPGGIIRIKGHVLPDETSKSGTTGYYLGVPDKRWKKLYCYANPDASSDIAYKRDIGELNASALLGALRPVRFRYKDMEEMRMGFIAQEVARAITCVGLSNAALVGGPDGNMSMCYTELIAPLVEGWQAHEAKLSALERRVAALEARLEGRT